MMIVVEVKSKEETQVVEVVALNMDHRMFDNMLDHCKSLDADNRNLVLVNDASMVDENFV
jgi:hypothetical protein